MLLLRRRLCDTYVGYTGRYPRSNTASLPFLPRPPSDHRIRRVDLHSISLHSTGASYSDVVRLNIRLTVPTFFSEYPVVENEFTFSDFISLSVGEGNCIVS